MKYDHDGPVSFWGGIFMKYYVVYHSFVLPAVVSGLSVYDWWFLSQQGTRIELLTYLE